MAFDTTSLFDVLAQDDTDIRVAQRRALALAQTRVENRMGAFLRGARSEEEFEQRLALLMDNFTGAVRTASTETGYDKPEHIAEAVKQHYAEQVEFVDPRAEEEDDPEGDESDSKASSVESESTPREASVKAGEWLLTPHTADKLDKKERDELPTSDFVDKKDRKFPIEDKDHAEKAEQFAKGPMKKKVDEEVHEKYPDLGKDSSFLAGEHTAVKEHMKGVSPHRNKQYEDIKEQLEDSGKSTDRAKEEAARTVNKQRAEHGETKGSSTHTAIGNGIAPTEPGAMAPTPPTPAAPPQQQPCPICGMTNCPHQQGQLTGMPTPNSAPVHASTGWTVFAEDGHGNTGLGGPEPKIDKAHTPLHGAPEGAADKQVDITQPLVPKNRTENPLDQMGDVKEESLPAASGDDSGFSTETPGGKGDHTKTFPKGDQTNPVTHETISSSEFPSHEAVRSALTRL